MFVSINLLFGKASIVTKIKKLNSTAPIDTSSGKKEEQPIVRVLIGDLFPGWEYKFHIHTVSYNLISDKTHLAARTLPLIQSEVFVVTDKHQRDIVTLTYTPTPQQSSKFDRYRFSLGDPDIPDQEKDANDEHRKVTFTGKSEIQSVVKIGFQTFTFRSIVGLIPGRLYNITIWTVSENIQSLPILRQDRMYPEPISELNATRISDTEITLNWDQPKGEFNSFEIQYLKTESDSDLTLNYTDKNTITVTDLKPHRNYTFTVVVRSGIESSVLRSSIPISASFTTKESVPGTVIDFEPIDIQPSQITFRWSLPPHEQNGVIRQFSITYGLEGSTHTNNKDFKSLEYQGTITGLLPGRAYSFRIQARTQVGYGPETSWKQKMPIRPPPKPASPIVPTEVYRSSTSIQIRFRKNYFSDSNGQVCSLIFLMLYICF